MSVMPEGENVRKAIKWISDKKQYEPEDCGPIMSMIEKAAKRFDLSPKDEQFLIRFFAALSRPDREVKFPKVTVKWSPICIRINRGEDPPQNFRL